MLLVWFPTYRKEKPYEKTAALTILFVFLLSSITAYAAEPRAVTVRPSLSFDGTTALCEVTVTSYGKSIDLTLSLWQGENLIEQWTASGTSLVSISESCTVVKGKSYKLTVSGTVNGEAISASTSGQCK